MFLRQWLSNIMVAARMPSVSVNLMHAATAENDAFYARLVCELYAQANRRHRKFPLIRQFEYGVALCPLPETFDKYFMAIEASARRNYKKSLRSGYEFRRIRYNDYLADIADIRRSAPVRQGALPDEFLKREVEPIADPPSRTNIHDYPFFGIVRDGKLVACAGCFVAGEICMIEHIYGHAQYQHDGIVPMLIIGIAEYTLAHYPVAKYYAYGTFFGAGQTMQRFKKKFLFMPHRATWKLGA